MTDLLRRPVVTLLLLVVLNMTLLSVQVRNEGGRTLFRAWSLSLFTPFAWGIHALSDRVSTLANDYVLLVGASEENARLRRENQAMRLEISKLRGLERFFERVPDYELVRRQFDFSTLPAAVVWKSPPFHSQRFFINAGTRHGVNKDCAVIGSRGLIGRVLVTTSFSAEVELITNAGAAAGALLPDSGLEGVIQGNGSRMLAWNFIPGYEEVEVGQTVCTSGSDQVYPKGVPIGRIVRSAKGSRIYRDIQVEPFVDFQRLEEVLVVTRK